MDEESSAPSALGTTRPKLDHAPPGCTFMGKCIGKCLDNGNLRRGLLQRPRRRAQLLRGRVLFRPLPSLCFTTLQTSGAFLEFWPCVAGTAKQTSTSSGCLTTSRFSNGSRACFDPSDQEGVLRHAFLSARECSPTQMATCHGARASPLWPVSTVGLNSAGASSALICPATSFTNEAISNILSFPASFNATRTPYCFLHAPLAVSFFLNGPSQISGGCKRCPTCTWWRRRRVFRARTCLAGVLWQPGSAWLEQLCGVRRPIFFSFCKRSDGGRKPYPLRYLFRRSFRSAALAARAGRCHLATPLRMSPLLHRQGPRWLPNRRRHACNARVCAHWRDLNYRRKPLRAQTTAQKGAPAMNGRLRAPPLRDKGPEGKGRPSSHAP